MDIKLFNLHRYPYYLPPHVIRDRTLFPADGPQNIKDWWVNARPEFRELVLAEKDVGDSVEAVGIIVERPDVVTIFSHEYNEKLNRHTNPQVIANSDIIEVLPLKETSKKPAAGDMIYAQWIDASHNNIPATINEIAGVRGIVTISQFGFFMHGDSERVIIGGSYSAKTKKYSYLGAIPTVTISKVTVMEV
jgi:hypothetical protein